MTRTVSKGKVRRQPGILQCHRRGVTSHGEPGCCHRALPGLCHMLRPTLGNTRQINLAGHRVSQVPNREEGDTRQINLAGLRSSGKGKYNGARPRAGIHRSRCGAPKPSGRQSRGCPWPEVVEREHGTTALPSVGRGSGSGPRGDGGPAGWGPPARPNMARGAGSASRAVRPGVR